MEVIRFLGRLHPMVVHLPIGFLLIAAAFDVISYHAKYRYLKDAVGTALLAGFLFAAIACVLGYLLSLSGSYDEDILENHRNAGIILAITSGVWWAASSTLFTGIVKAGRRFTTAFGLLVVTVMLYAGHQGGSLTHGSDYLSFQETDKIKRPKPLTAADALVFEDVVFPILERKCEGCHRKGKRKGELIVSTYADLMKGGKDGVVVVAGNLANSELYRRITLDPDHKDFMPTDGKKPLTKEETTMITWWIEKAQASNELKIAAVEGHQELLPIVNAIIGLEGSGLNDATVINAKLPNPDIPSTTDEAAIDNLRKHGVMVRAMLHSPVMLDVILPSGTVMKEVESDLHAIARNIVWLNLSGNNLETKDLVAVKEMSNLEKLRLERNSVGDDLIEIVKDLKHLEALNINDTKVTDAGYSKLKELPSIKRIYRWSSGAK
ncbi:DUF2231 domain-containing protein [Chryseolinea sp. T2]|uniref:DUF2231 domain-containing protein n=1 Tax=Chryseolinea sp. T2 TaxID=3129255 RepID=UPI003076B03C